MPNRRWNIPRASAREVDLLITNLDSVVRAELSVKFAESGVPGAVGKYVLLVKFKNKVAPNFPVTNYTRHRAFAVNDGLSEVMFSTIRNLAWSIYTMSSLEMLEE